MRFKKYGDYDEVINQKLFSENSGKQSGSLSDISQIR